MVLFQCGDGKRIWQRNFLCPDFIQRWNTVAEFQNQTLLQGRPSKPFIHTICQTSMVSRNGKRK